MFQLQICAKAGVRGCDLEDTTPSAPEKSTPNWAVNRHKEFPTDQQALQVYPHHCRKIKTWNGTGGSLYLVNRPKEEKRLIDQSPIFVQHTLITLTPPPLQAQRPTPYKAEHSVPAPALTQSSESCSVKTRILP